MANGGNEHWFFPLLVTTILLSQSAASEQNGLFKVSDLNLIEPVDTEVVPAFITNPKLANLIVRQITEDHQRSLKIFSLADDGQYVDGEVDDIQIDKDVIFF